MGTIQQQKMSITFRVSVSANLTHAQLLPSKESEESWSKIGTDRDKRIATHTGPHDRFSARRYCEKDREPAPIPGDTADTKIERTNPKPKQQNECNELYLFL